MTREASLTSLGSVWSALSFPDNFARDREVTPLLNLQHSLLQLPSFKFCLSLSLGPNAGLSKLEALCFHTLNLNQLPYLC